MLAKLCRILDAKRRGLDFLLWAMEWGTGLMGFRSITANVRTLDWGMGVAGGRGPVGGA